MHAHHTAMSCRRSQHHHAPAASNAAYRLKQASSLQRALMIGAPPVTGYEEVSDWQRIMRFALAALNRKLNETQRCTYIPATEHQSRQWVDVEEEDTASVLGFHSRIEVPAVQAVPEQVVPYNLLSFEQVVQHGFLNREMCEIMFTFAGRDVLIVFEFVDENPLPDDNSYHRVTDETSVKISMEILRYNSAVPLHGPIQYNYVPFGSLRKNLRQYLKMCLEVALKTP